MSASAVPTQGEDTFGDNRWIAMHKAFLAEGQEKEPEVVMIGDHAIAYLQLSEVWEKKFAPLHCLNFGIPSDQTQHVLWRIENGELEGVNPKVVVLSVGSSNYSDTVEMVAEGIDACVSAITKRLPNAQVVVIKLLPCGPAPNPLREKRADVNSLLSRSLKNKPNVQLVDLDPGFVQQDGSINCHDLFDFEHLNKQGYNTAFTPLADLVEQLLCEASGAGGDASGDL
uniref:Putative attractin and platelet-activating factor acetylhydrolase n=1 Tax=Ornithodoros turicata TaxID=34597 RepID=A0A2R5LCV2_9ACAR